MSATLQIPCRITKQPRVRRIAALAFCGALKSSSSIYALFFYVLLFCILFICSPFFCTPTLAAESVTTSPLTDSADADIPTPLLSPKAKAEPSIQKSSPPELQSTMNSAAQRYFKNLSNKSIAGSADAKDNDKADAAKVPNTATVVNKMGPIEIQKLDEIRVTDRVDPEDYVAPKLTPMLVFRAKLDAQRPMTPAEMTKFLLCSPSVKILCYVDPNQGLTAQDRNEERAKNPDSFIFR